MACTNHQLSLPLAGQMTVEVRSGSGNGKDCNLSLGSQPHIVTVTNLEVFPVYIDCDNSIAYPPPTPVEFRSPTHTVSPISWAVCQQRVGGIPPANSLTLNHVNLVSMFTGTPTVRTTVSGQWTGHYLQATIDAGITVKT
jgi:hypothetical protein